MGDRPCRAWCQPHEAFPGIEWISSATRDGTPALRMGRNSSIAALAEWGLSPDDVGRFLWAGNGRALRWMLHGAATEGGRLLPERVNADHHWTSADDGKAAFDGLKMASSTGGRGIEWTRTAELFERSHAGTKARAYLAQRGFTASEQRIEAETQVPKGADNEALHRALELGEQGEGFAPWVMFRSPAGWRARNTYATATTRWLGGGSTGPDGAWWVPGHAWAVLRSGEPFDAVIVEGPLDALAFACMVAEVGGRPVVPLSINGSSRAAAVRLAKNIAAGMLGTLAGSSATPRRVWLALDADEAGLECMRAAFSELVALPVPIAPAWPPTIEAGRAAYLGHKDIADAFGAMRGAGGSARILADAIADGMREGRRWALEESHA